MVKFALIAVILLGQSYCADVSDSERLDSLIKKFDDLSFRFNDLSTEFNDLSVENKVR